MICAADAVSVVVRGLVVDCTADRIEQLVLYAAADRALQVVDLEVGNIYK